MYYVYVYSDPRDDVPFYVGKGKGDRAYKHLRETKDNTENYLKYCKIKSLLNEGILPKIDIVFTSSNEQDCLNKEAELIAHYGRKVDGGVLTNIVTSHSDFLSNQAKLPRSKQYKQNMSEAKRGSKNPMFGIEPWNKGVPCSDEVKQKISNANQGRCYTTEERDRRQATRGKVYVVIDPLGNEHCVINLKAWAQERGLCPVNLRLALVGYKGKTQYKGYTGHSTGITTAQWLKQNSPTS